MNFTREPIIETVITPREGCKLVVRSSKANGQEDYFVDAVEVVSFGHSFFFRSSEKPKSFLVPVSDYEILELRETRMVLKHVPTERSVKIGGGRDAGPPRPQHQDYRPEKEATPEEEGAAPAPESSDPANRNKRDRRRRGRRGRPERGPDTQAPTSDTGDQPPAEASTEATPHAEAQPASEKPAPKPFRLFAPPALFIKRPKPPEQEVSAEPTPEPQVHEEPFDSFQEDRGDGPQLEE